MCTGLILFVCRYAWPIGPNTFAIWSPDPQHWKPINHSFLSSFLLLLFLSVASGDHVWQRLLLHPRLQLRLRCDARLCEQGGCGGRSQWCAHPSSISSSTLASVTRLQCVCFVSLIASFYSCSFFVALRLYFAFQWLRWIVPRFRSVRSARANSRPRTCQRCVSCVGFHQPSQFLCLTTIFFLSVPCLFFFFFLLFLFFFAFVFAAFAHRVVGSALARATTGAGTPIAFFSSSSLF